VLRRALFRVYKDAAKLIFGSSLERYYPAHPLHRRLLASIRPDVTTVRGHEMYLDPVDSLLLSMRGIYEPAETALVQRLVEPGSTVLDIGANIGYYTLQFAELVGASGRVIAYEPDPANFELLERNTQLNGYLNVTLVQRAASNTAGILNLHRSITNWGDSRIFDSHDGRSTVEIASIRLDDHLADLDSVSFIKMDIQGAEGVALEGMMGLLGRSPQAKILTEFWPEGLAGCGTSPQAFLDSITALGFALYEVGEEPGDLVLTTSQSLMARRDLASGSHANLLCSRQPMHLRASSE